MLITAKVRLIEDLLASVPGDKDLLETWIASKAPTAKTKKEEVEASGTDSVVAKMRCIFPRGDDGNPFLWDYQVKGFFKAACGFLNRAEGSYSSQLSAYLKVINGLVFPKPRKIVIPCDNLGTCERPLRITDFREGDRTALASSETIPAGTEFSFSVELFDLKNNKVKLEDCVKEWLEYGQYHGLCQWRNSGKGRFELLDLTTEQNSFGTFKYLLGKAREDELKKADKKTPKAKKQTKKILKE